MSSIKCYLKDRSGASHASSLRPEVQKPVEEQSFLSFGKGSFARDYLRREER